MHSDVRWLPVHYQMELPSFHSRAVCQLLVCLVVLNSQTFWTVSFVFSFNLFYVFDVVWQPLRARYLLHVASYPVTYLQFCEDGKTGQGSFPFRPCLSSLSPALLIVFLSVPIFFPPLSLAVAAASGPQMLWCPGNVVGFPIRKVSTLCLKMFPSLNSLTLSTLNRFSKFRHCWKAYEICYNIATSPQACCYSTWEIKNSNFLQIFSRYMYVWKKMQTNCILSAPILIPLLM